MVYQIKIGFTFWISTSLTLKTSTKLLPNNTRKGKSYQHCLLRCCCMEAEPQLLPVDSLLAPPHWEAAERVKTHFVA